MPYDNHRPQPPVPRPTHSLPRAPCSCPGPLSVWDRRQRPQPAPPVREHFFHAPVIFSCAAAESPLVPLPQPGFLSLKLCLPSPRKRPPFSIYFFLLPGQLSCAANPSKASP